MAGSDLPAALAAVRALADDRVRITAFRAIAEIEAARLDAGRLASGSVPATGEGRAVHTASQLAAAEGLSLLTGDGVRATTPAFLPPVPDLSATADTVRAVVPLSDPGVGELSLAGLNRFTQLNRFNSKFLEDVVGTTAREHILRTQGTINPTFIYLTDGVFTARDLLHAIDTSKGDQLVRAGGVYTLRVPLVIGQDATLVLSGLDAPEFRLSADAGAFIINAGRLFVVDTRLTAWNETEAAPAHATYATKHAFRPFVTAWSGSETNIAAAVVSGLGYSAGKSYGLTFSSGPKDGKGATEALARPKGLLVDSVFRNLYYGFYTYEADDVAVIGNVYDDSVVYGLDPHDRSLRLVMAFNTLYGTQEKHGAIFSRDVKDSVLWGNVSFDNAGSGFMLDRRSTRSLVWANVALANAQDGMTVYESPCVLIGANRFEANGRAGIKIRNSWSVLVDGNHVAGNAGTGLEAYVADLAATEDGALRDLHEDPYLPVASFSARDNTILGTAKAVSARGISSAAFSGNRFAGQGAAVFDGDLKPLRVNLLRAAGSGRSATAVPADVGAPSRADAEAAGTLDCPPPGPRASAPRPAS
jgi:poly(beta-D-mannuronate) C5 epimerase